MNNKQITLEKFDELVLSNKATWWEMKLPSGDVLFGEAKAKMLGYPESNFKKYKDFTDLLHREDYEKAMQAMRDHLEGKKPFYEVLYRIKNKDGEYIQFYDCGQIVKKDGEDITVMGFLIKVDEKEDITGQMSVFKKLILEGSPSMIDLVKKMRGV